MRKPASLFFVLIILLCLCACGKGEVPSTAPTDTTPDQTTSSTADTTAQATNDTASNTSKVTKDTTTQIADDDHITKSPTKQTANIEKTTVKRIDTTTTTPNGCNHDYTVASCNVPKICTKCQHIAGHTLPHSYKNGTCTVCGQAEMLVTFEAGDWVARTVTAGTSEQGEILSEYVLRIRTANDARYSLVVCYSNANACVMNVGKIIHNEKTYCADFYPSCFFSVEMKESGDTITFTFDRESSTPPFEFVLTKTSETQCVVTSTSDAARMPLNLVFVKQ